MNDILNSFVSGIARQDALKQQAAQQQLAQQTQDQANDYHQGLLSDAMDTLDETKRQNSAHLKIATELHNAQMDKMRAELAHSVESGYTVPGSQILGERKDPITGYRIRKVQLPDSANRPDGSPTIVDLMHPEDHAAAQANVERITNAPKTEQKITEAIGTQNAMAEKQKEVNADKFVFDSKLREDHDKVLSRINDDKLKNAKDVADISGKYHLGAAQIGANAAITGHQIAANATLSAAKIRTGADLFGEAGTEGKVDPSPYIKAIQEGRMTQEQFDNQFKGAPQAGAYLKRAAFESSGAVPITNKQQQNLGSYQQLYALIPKMKALANASALSPLQNYEASMEIDSQIAKVANVLGGDRGQKLQKMLIDKAKGLTPGMMTPKGMANARVAFFEKTLKDTFKDDFSTQSENQRKSLWNQVAPPTLPQLKSPTEGLPSN